VFQPLPLLRSMVGGRVWARPRKPGGRGETGAAPAKN
jgi:hypothetical protein